MKQLIISNLLCSGNTEVDGVNRIFKKTIIAVLLKFLNTFCRLLETQLIKCKGKLKGKADKIIVFFTAGADKTVVYTINIVVTLKDPKSYVLVVIICPRRNKKQTKIAKASKQRI